MKPRWVPEGRVWFLSRRCTQRKFLLRPSSRANEAFRYCLAVAAKKAEVQVLWCVVMSNHHHTGIYDPHGRIVEFTRELHRLVAKHHNAMLGRWENLWASESPTDILLHDPQDILDKLIYSLANPCSANLVDEARHWPGVISLPEQLGRSIEVQKPKTYFRADGSMPESIELEFHLPPQFRHMEPDAFRAMVQARLAEAESKSRARRTNAGRRVLGRRQVLRQEPEQNPDSFDPRRGLRPRIAAKSIWRRIEAIRALKAFYDEHAKARLRWLTGDRDVEFPYGTYAMRVFHGARCGICPS